MMGFIFRFLAVALPILLFFLLPSLGVAPGFGFTLLAALLIAFPLFAFEFGNGGEFDRAVSKARGQRRNHS